MTRPFTALLCLAFAAAGCDVRSTLFCGMHPDDPRCATTGDGGSGVDAPVTACTGSADCTGHAGTPACDTSTGVCVECVANADCVDDTEPTCGSDHACRACAQHADCDSQVCLDSGACAAGSNVAYLAANGSGSDCSLATPCSDTTVALATMRPYVRVYGSNTLASAVDLAQDVTFLGDPGTSTFIGQGDSTFTVDSHAVVFEDLTLKSSSITGVTVQTNNTGTPSITINRCTMTGGGQAIDASVGTVTISRTQIRRNFGGGITLGTPTRPMMFSVTNSFIVLNGTQGMSSLGGASIFPAAGAVFTFNTVADNFDVLPPTAGGGVVCTTSTSFVANDNLFAGNVGGSNSTASTQLTGTGCTPGSSRTDADSAPLHFVDPGLAGSGDYHLTATSALAIDQAIGSDIKIDFDGQVRPNGSASDLGADEFYAP